MKREKIFLSVFLVLFLVLTVGILLIRKSDAKPGISLDTAEMNPVIKNADSLKIMVDPRIELLSAVQLDSDYETLTKLEFRYASDMKEYFRNHKNHMAVRTFRRLRNIGYGYDAPPTSMLYLSEPPELKQNIDFDEDIIKRTGNEKSLTDFIGYLRNFGSDADFPDFYEKNLPFYQAIVDNVYNDIKDMKLTKALDDYYGMEVNSYNIILAPMFHDGGYGPRIKGTNGLYDVYALIGPSGTIDGEDSEKIPDFSVDTIQYLVWHEFSHSFVNPATEKYADEINKYSDLFTNIRTQMEAQAYPEWTICVNEHIVRAITARLTYIYSGQAAGDQSVANEKSKGFYYIEPLCDSLIIYEENRDKYPTFESYYPELIKVFQKLSEQDTPIKFDGPVNLAFGFNNLDTVFIVPTKEKDQAVQEGITKYVEMIKDKFFPKAEILLDTDALEQDLGSRVIIAYGTIEGNLWLQKYKDTFPFQIGPDKTVADKEYTDEGLVLISALPNPQNSANPLVIYTAGRAEDIIDINSVFHGATDYVIAKEGKEITSGYYSKENDNWEFKD